MKNALIVASVASMIDQFNMPNIKLLIEMGYKVDVACNYVDGNTCNRNRIDQLRKTLFEMGCNCFQIDFARDIAMIVQNYRAYKELKKLAAVKHYDIIHCQSPIGGVIGRLIFIKHRKNGTKVIYTAHGFHFYKGAPIINWILYYPVEKIASCITDVLITINKEDYLFAKKKMKAKEVKYIAGIGVDICKFENTVVDAKAKKAEISVPNDAYLVLSVGELNTNKNHEIIIRAVALLQNTNIHYAVAGKGKLENYLLDLAKSLGVSEKLHLLGFRNDISELYKTANLYAHPSFREGLSVALTEAIASGVAVICSDIRGNTDLVDKDARFDPHNVGSVVAVIKQFLNGDSKEKIKNNYENLRQYDLTQVLNTMREIYNF